MIQKSVAMRYSSRGLHSLLISFFILSLPFLKGCASSTSKNNSVSSTYNQSVTSENNEKISTAKRIFKDKTSASRSRNEANVAKAKSMIEEHIGDKKLRTFLLTDKIYSKFEGFKNTWNITYKLAKDNLFDTHEAEKYVNEATIPAQEELKEISEYINKVLKSAVSDSDKEFQELHKDLVVYLDSEHLTANDLKIGSAINEMNSKILNQSEQIASLNIIATVKIAAEAFLIHETVKAVKVILRTIVQKGSKTIIAAGTAVVANGPLPKGEFIGAVIAVGGAASTAMDIWQAVKEMEQLREKIKKGIARSLDDIEQKADDSLRSLQNAHIQIYSKLDN